MRGVTWVLLACTALASAFEPFTTVRIIQGGVRYLSSPGHQRLFRTLRAVSSSKGGVLIPNLTCARTVKIVHRYGTRKSTKTMIKILKPVVERYVLATLQLGEEDLPLWMAMSVDTLLDYISEW